VLGVFGVGVVFKKRGVKPHLQKNRTSIECGFLN